MRIETIQPDGTIKSVTYPNITGYATEQFVSGNKEFSIRVGGEKSEVQIVFLESELDSIIDQFRMMLVTDEDEDDDYFEEAARQERWDYLDELYNEGE